MIKIGIFSSTRGDMSILTPLVKEIEKSKNMTYQFFVGGTHLKKKYGNTINEIKKNNIRITDKFNYRISGDKPHDIGLSLSESHLKVNLIFQKYKFDVVCILGDRFEKLAIVNHAVIFNKPIIHLHGGEITEGVIDNHIRQMISKAANLHFVICEKYKKNLINIGEKKKNIFNYGSLAIDNIKKLKKIPKSKLFRNLKLKENKPTILLTYHPVTIENKISTLQQVKNIFYNLIKKKFQIIVTSPGHESGRSIIENYIKKLSKEFNQIKYIDSLGHEALFNILPYCKFVIGNSSSGIIEVPYFKIPTINIGDRQKGRYMHLSVINTGYSKQSIVKAINLACNVNFNKKIKRMKYNFGTGNTAKKIIKKIKNLNINQDLLRKL